MKKREEAITAIIVDDEAHARQALRHLLNSCSDIDVLAECENGLAAIKTIQQLSPTVMFLDIHMPKLDGFDVLELLGDSAPTVVFVTAHDDYAIQAFDANAIDYLLKPVSAERLSQTVTRLVQRLLQQRPQHHLPGSLPSLSHKERRSNLTESLLQKHQHQKAPISRILIRDKADVILVPTTEVMAIAAADDYVVVQSTQGNHIKQERLNNLEALLDPNNFCRIHRSCIINLAFLKAIETEGRENRFALLHNNQQFPISRNGYARLLKLL